MGEGSKDGGFVKNFVARLNAGNGGGTSSRQPSVRSSSSMARISASRTASVSVPPGSPSLVSHQQSFRSREVGDTALPTVIKGTRGADGASLPLRPSAAQGVAEVDNTQFKTNRRASQPDPTTVVEENSGAASARAFWEAKSRTGPSYTKKAGTQLQSFSQCSSGTQSLRSQEGEKPWQQSRRESGNGVQSRRESGAQGRRESGGERVATLAKTWSQQSLSTQSLPGGCTSWASSGGTAASNNGRNAVATPGSSGISRVRRDSGSNGNSVVTSSVKPVSSVSATTSSASSNAPERPAVEKVVAKEEPPPVITPTPTIVEVEEEVANGAAESEEEPEVEDSSDGETAGGYSFGNADSDDDDDKDSDSDCGAGSYSFGAKESDDEEETKTVDEAPPSPKSTADAAKGIWYKYTSGSEFAAPPIRQRRNVEGEMEVVEENTRARYIGFNDVVTVFEDDLAGSQHHYTFMFNW